MRVASAAATKAMADDVRIRFQTWVNMAATRRHRKQADQIDARSTLAWQQMADRMVFFHRMSTSLDELSQPSLLTSMIRSLSVRAETTQHLATIAHTDKIKQEIEIVDPPLNATSTATVEVAKTMLDPFDDFESARLHSRSRLRVRRDTVGEYSTSVVQRKAVFDTVRSIEDRHMQMQSQPWCWSTGTCAEPEERIASRDMSATEHAKSCELAERLGCKQEPPSAPRTLQSIRGIGVIYESTRSHPHAGDSTVEDPVRRTLIYPS